MRAISLILLLLGGCLSGCSGVKKIGKVSLTPILHIQVGTTVNLYWPEITYEDEEEAKVP